MYTQCPQCLTYFRVTPEHLKVAQGKVRCGQCRNVFNALGNLLETLPFEIELEDNELEEKKATDKKKLESNPEYLKKLNSIKKKIQEIHSIPPERETLKATIDATKELERQNKLRKNKLHQTKEPGQISSKDKNIELKIRSRSGPYSRDEVHARLHNIKDNSHVLDLSGLSLTDGTLPDELFSNKNITILVLSSNYLTTLPERIGELINLQVLYIVDNRLKAIPDSIANLKNLKKLYINNNRITHIPENIVKLEQLSVLDISNNALTKLPENLGQLRGLQELLLGNNCLDSLPVSIKNLTNLSLFTIDDNPLRQLPLEIVQNGLHSIRSYLTQIELQEKDYLYEAKLLIVGEPGAGKTTLLKKLIDPKYAVPNKSESTVGINIKEWVFKTTDKKDKTIPFRVNLWDFGGHEIQLLMHHFFLTSSSLYVLVSDSREERTNFHYWFNIVQMLSDKSPILVLFNNKNGRYSIPTSSASSYLSHYSAMIKSVHNLDLSLSDGQFESFVNDIKNQLMQLKHIGYPLPKSWIAVREKLEQIKETKSFIAFDNYKELCASNSILEEEDQLQLSSYLHSIGVILHFQNDADISYWMVLDPKWVVNAVFTILKEKKVYLQGGRFNKEWLYSKWKNYSYSEKQYLLSLLLKNRFDICYEIAGNKGEYIVPKLLPSKEPDNEFDENGSMNYRFQYNIMPVGLISRVIVRLSSYLMEENGRTLNWRTGALFKKENVIAKIAEKSQSIIDIQLKGPEFESREFLANIRYVIESIHQDSFQGIAHKQLIPCKECLKSKTTNTKYFEYIHLANMISRGIPDIVCEHCYKKVQPTDLVLGVLTKQEYNREITISPVIINTEGSKMETHINIKGGHASIYNADQMTIINTAGEAGNITKEQKEKLLSLSTEFTRIAENIDTKGRNSLNEKLEQFIKEVVNRNKDDSRISISAEGLKKAAAAVGDIASPIIKTVDSVLDLLFKVGA